MKRLEEIKRGLTRTAQYLLSHHGEDGKDRCYSLSLAGKKLFFCARCTGIYPGMIAAAVLFATVLPPPFLPVVLLPLPALLEKYVETAREVTVPNLVRTVNGVMLGAGYMAGLSRLLQAAPDFRVLAVGAVYGLAGLWVYTRLS